MSDDQPITDTEIEARELHKLCVRYFRLVQSKGGTIDDCAGFLLTQGYTFSRINKFFEGSELFYRDVLTDAMMLNVAQLAVERDE